MEQSWLLLKFIHKHVNLHATNIISHRMSWNLNNYVAFRRRQLFSANYWLCERKHKKSFLTYNVPVNDTNLGNDSIELLVLIIAGPWTFACDLLSG